MRSMTFFNFLLEATLIGSIMILLLMLARFLFRRKMGSRLVYAAWLLIALRLLLPLSLPNPLMNELRPGLSRDMAARPVADQIRTRIIDAAWHTAQAVANLTGDGEVSYAIESFGSRTYEGATGKWFLLAYALVALAFIIWAICRNIRFCRWIKRNRVRELSGDDLDMYRRLCVRFLAKPVPAYYVDKLKAPCTIGVIHPMIALPEGIQPQHLQAILSHQLSHVKSHDGIWAVVRLCCCVVHWFNPLVWMGAYLCREDAEMSCDALATSKMTNSERIAYADALAATHGADIHGVFLMATDGGGRERQMRTRMTAVLGNVHVKTCTVTLAAVICGFVLVGAFMTGEKYAPVRITVLPQVRWQAGVQSIQDAMDAVGHTRRFLESPYINVSTSRFAFTAQKEHSGAETVWRVEGGIQSDGVHLTVRFKENGVLVSYDGLYQAEDVDKALREPTAPVVPGEMIEYLKGFNDACLPCEEWIGAEFEGDALGRGGMLFTLRMNLRDQSRGDGRHAAIVTLLSRDDEVRVVAYDAQNQ